MDTITRVPQRIRFEVADVTPAPHVLLHGPLKPALERNLRLKVLSGLDDQTEIIKGADFHPLIAAAFVAFKRHYPLVLSPDMLWITILQGVSQHIQNNAEHLRHRLVHHETKIE